MDQELGIYSEVPRIARAAKAVNQVILTLFLRQPMRTLVGLTSGVILVVLFTAKTRDVMDNIWLGGLLLVFMLMVRLALVGLLFRRPQSVVSFVLGKPAFGQLGGLPRRTFVAGIKAAKSLELHFGPEDQKTLEELRQLELDVGEAVLRGQFVKTHGDESLEGESAETRWTEFWNTKILGMRVGNGTYGEALLRNFNLQILPLRLVGTFQLVAPLVDLFLVVTIWTVYLGLTGTDRFLVLTFQLGLPLSFFISVIVFLNHALTLAEIPIETEHQLSALPEQFHERALQLGEKSVRPLRVEAGGEFFSTIRDYFGGALLRVGIIAILVELTILGLALVSGVLAAPSDRSDLMSWYGRFAAGMVILPVLLVVGHYAAFFILQNLRRLLAPLVSGIVVAAVPLAYAYATKGELPSDVSDVLTSLALGVVGTGAAAAGSQIKTALERNQT